MIITVFVYFLSSHHPSITGSHPQSLVRHRPSQARILLPSLARHLHPRSIRNHHSSSARIHCPHFVQVFIQAQPETLAKVQLTVIMHIQSAVIFSSIRSHYSSSTRILCPSLISNLLTQKSAFKTTKKSSSHPSPKLSFQISQKSSSNSSQKSLFKFSQKSSFKLSQKQSSCLDRCLYKPSQTPSSLSSPEPLFKPIQQPDSKSSEKFSFNPSQKPSSNPIQAQSITLTPTAWDSPSLHSMAQPAPTVQSDSNASFDPQLLPFYVTKKPHYPVTLAPLVQLLYLSRPLTHSSLTYS